MLTTKSWETSRSAQSVGRNSTVRMNLWVEAHAQAALVPHVDRVMYT